MSETEKTAVAPAPDAGACEQIELNYGFRLDKAVLNFTDPNLRMMINLSLLCFGDPPFKKTYEEFCIQRELEFLARLESGELIGFYNHDFPHGDGWKPLPAHRFSAFRFSNPTFERDLEKPLTLVPGDLHEVRVRERRPDEPRPTAEEETTRPTGTGKNRGGRKPKFQWADFHIWLGTRIYEKGVPESGDGGQTGFAKEAVSWFASRYGGEPPNKSQINQEIAKALQEYRKRLKIKDN